MRALASLVCGFVFGWGLFISAMIQPAKVLGFLDVFGIPGGTWHPSLAVVMAAALAVASVGYALIRQRRPILDTEAYWPTQTPIDRPLVAGSVLFGIGWGLVGLCPGPAIENLGNAVVAGDHLRRRHGGRHGRAKFLASARRGIDREHARAGKRRRRLEARQSARVNGRTAD